MLIRFFVFILVIYLLFKIINTIRQLNPAKSENYQFKSSSAGGEDLVEDPVCHTYIPLSQAYKKEISGKSYYFCSQQCSEKYLSGENN
jgi:YHS domain-containing protein